jgi:hypothetical protein
VASAANMARHHALWMVLSCCLLATLWGVGASGRHLLATNNTTGIYYGEHCLHWRWKGCCSRCGGLLLQCAQSPVLLLH